MRTELRLALDPLRKGRLLDTVPDERIVSARTVHAGDVCISMMLRSVEMNDAAGGRLRPLPMKEQTA